MRARRGALASSSSSSSSLPCSLDADDSFHNFTHKQPRASAFSSLHTHTTFALGGFPPTPSPKRDKALRPFPTKQAKTMPAMHASRKGASSMRARNSRERARAASWPVRRQLSTRARARGGARARSNTHTTALLAPPSPPRKPSRSVRARGRPARPGSRRDCSSPPKKPIAVGASVPR